MDHQCIAHVHDGGSTESGRPYFVMELVDGTPITEYCDAARFTTRQRLELFIQVCHAVQHAHLKGVIHRDIKPSNILVDASGAPYLTDFGVAADHGLERLGANDEQLGLFVADRRHHRAVLGATREVTYAKNNGQNSR